MMHTLSKIADELDSIAADYSGKLWSQYTTGLDFGVDASLQKINAFKKNPENFKVVTRSLETETDPVEKRKAQIMYKDFHKFHQSEKCTKLIEEIQKLENLLMDLLNKHRVVLDGVEKTSNEIGDIVSKSPDRELRRRAYMSRAPLNKVLVDAGFIKLLDLRKELALAAGYDNYVSYRLSEDELTPEVFQGWQEICVKSRDLYQKNLQGLAQTHLQQAEMRPWDFSYLMGKICPYNNAKVEMTSFFDPMAKTFAKFGFDIRNLNLTFDIFPRKNKSEWGYNFTIKTGVDSRVLANVTNMFRDYWVLLHETGHGVHFLGLDPKNTALNNGVSGIVAEGFANFMGDQVYSKEFLSEVFPAEELEAAYGQFAALKKARDLKNISFIETCLFDQELYRQNINSLQDLNDLKSSMAQKLMGEKPEGETPWAHVIHHTCAPVYFHNYFLGDVMCEKMKVVFKKRTGKEAHQDTLAFGQMWKNEVLDPSGRYVFGDLYQRICGEPVGISDYVNEALS